MSTAESASWSSESDVNSLSSLEDTPSSISTISPQLVAELWLLVTFGGEFTSFDEPTKDVDIVVDAELSTDGPEQIGSDRRVEPLDPMQKLRLPIVRSIPWSRMLKTGIWAGGCGRKSMEPNRIWPPMIVELLLGEAERATESMTPMPRFSTDRAN
jgi:hypothetical protein